MTDERAATARAILGSLEAGCEVLDEPWGTIVANPEFHRIHMANFTWIREVPPGGLAAILERTEAVFRPYKIPHRQLFVEDPVLAGSVGRALTASGYIDKPSHLMVARREPSIAANPDVVLRPARDQATRDDHDAIAGLIDEEEGYDYEVSHQLLALQWRRAEAMGREVYVAYRGGEAAGVISLDDVGGVGLIPEVATAPAHRRHGVAATMVLGVRRRADERGLDPVCLETAVRATAHEMYEKLGFDRIGTLAGYLKDPITTPREA